MPDVIKIEIVDAVMHHRAFKDQMTFAEVLEAYLIVMGSSIDVGLELADLDSLRITIGEEVRNGNTAFADLIYSRFTDEGRDFADLCTTAKAWPKQIGFHKGVEELTVSWQIGDSVAICVSNQSNMSKLFFDTHLGFEGLLALTKQSAEKKV